MPQCSGGDVGREVTKPVRAGRTITFGDRRIDVLEVTDRSVILRFVGFAEHITVAKTVENVILEP